MTKEFFKEEPMFSGWKEFNTPIGWMRAENRGLGIYSLYIKQSHPMGDSFIHSAIVRSDKKKPTAKDLYDLYIELQDEDEEYNDDEELESEEE